MTSALRDLQQAVKDPEATAQQLAAAITVLLQQLPRLEVLELPGFPMSDAALQHAAQVGCMQGLQAVSFDHATTRLPATGGACHAASHSLTSAATCMESARARRFPQSCSRSQVC